MDSKHIVDYHGYPHCYWCGEPIKIEVEWDEYTKSETRRCNCAFAIAEIEYKSKIEDCQEGLRVLEITRPNSGKNTEYKAECEKLSYKYRGRGL